MIESNRFIYMNQVKSKWTINSTSDFDFDFERWFHNFSIVDSRNC